MVRMESGKPTQTAATSSGVYPTNHASDHSSPVPVLPATATPVWAYLFGTKDQKESMGAFLEKRKPSLKDTIDDYPLPPLPTEIRACSTL